MDSKMMKKSTPLSEEQKKVLVEYMRSRENLQKGKFTNTFSYKDAANMWAEITEILNSIPGSRKNWKDWRRTWHDLRARVKSKASKINKNMLGTGGGAPSKNLSVIEEDVVNILSPIVLEGIGTRESVTKEVILLNNIDFSSEDTKDHMTTLPTGEKSEDSSLVQNSTTLLHSDKSNDEGDKQEVETVTNTIQVAGKRSSKKARLEKTLSVASQMSEQWKERTKIEDNFGKQKVILLQRRLELQEEKIQIAERNAAAQERIASAQENIAEVLNNISKTLDQFIDQCF